MSHGRQHNAQSARGQIDGCDPSNVNGQYMKIELYDAPTLNHIPDPSANMVTWSPLPCVAGGQELFYNRRDAGYCADPRTGANVAFPWHEYTPSNGYGNRLHPTRSTKCQVAQLALPARIRILTSTSTELPGPTRCWSSATLVRAGRYNYPVPL